MFIAKDCQKVTKQKLDSAEKIKVKEVSFDEFIDLVSSGKLGPVELMVRVLQSQLNSSKMEKLRKLFLN